MAFNVNTYVPSDVTLAFGGYPLTGWNTISLTKNAPSYTPVRGMRGKNTRYRNTDSSATISFSCLQTGEANDLLSEVYKQDFRTGNGRISLTLKDGSGSSIFHSSEGFITSLPNIVYSDGFEYRVWTIFCLSSEADWTVGGNLQAQDSLFSKATSFVGDTLSSIF